MLFLCLKSSPPHAMDPSNTVHVLLPSCNFHQQSRENLLSSLGFCNNQYTDILPGVSTNFPFCVMELFLVLGRDTSERTEVMGQPFQRSFKSSLLGFYWWFSGQESTLWCKGLISGWGTKIPHAEKHLTNTPQLESPYTLMKDLELCNQDPERQPNK